MKPISSNWVAVFCISCCVGLTVFIFSASRADSGLRMAALVSSTSIAAALIAIASTMLTGKDVTHPPPPDLPPNSSGTLRTTTEQTIQTPATPVASNLPEVKP